jgi:3-hydroxyisobutyrate dehydrogenase-like beta-hydroxyacid dehydrogenase
MKLQPPVPISFLGIGLMGRPIAMNLLRAEYQLTVWNRTASKAADLNSAGAHLAIAEDHARLVEQIGLRYIDAPVSGGTSGAEKGTLPSCPEAPNPISSMRVQFLPLWVT